MDQQLITKVKETVAELFKEKYDKRSTYHSFEHTKEVAEAAEKIGKNAGLSERELEVVVIAAWFHDTGYLINMHDHETHSAKYAGEVLKTLNYPDDLIKQVQSNIMATRINHTPSNLMEEVIHDADYINLANPDNLKQSQLLRDELVNFGGPPPTEEEWLTAELKFLLNHRYYTEYSRNKLEDKKEDNIKKIKKKLKQFRKDEAFATPRFTEEIPVPTMEKKDVRPLPINENGTIIPATHDKKTEENEVRMDSKIDMYKNDEIKDPSDKSMLKQEEKEKSKEKDKEKDKDKDKDDKGKGAVKKDDKILDKRYALAVKEFDSIYRLVATNHMRMNAIADRKANIMLSLNGIIISITLSVVAAASASNLRFIIPTSILILVCLVTIIFAALSTRPNVTSGTVSKEDIMDKKANLLFFGNFSKMQMDDFDWGFRKIITDQEYLHNSMIIDFYSLGKVLDAKYKYLRICYNVFMYGIVLSVLSVAFLIAIGY